jgi:hypothetical protein
LFIGVVVVVERVGVVEREEKPAKCCRRAVGGVEKPSDCC